MLRLSAEIIALHEANVPYRDNQLRGAQFYMSCIQIRVTSQGSATLPGGTTFPGPFFFEFVQPPYIKHLGYFPKDLTPTRRLESYGTSTTNSLIKTLTNHPLPPFGLVPWAGRSLLEVDLILAVRKLLFTAE